MPREIGTGIWVDKQPEKTDFRLENDPQNSPISLQLIKYGIVVLIRLRVPRYKWWLAYYL